MKFKIGQEVRYIGRTLSTYWPHGTIITLRQRNKCTYFARSRGLSFWVLPLELKTLHKTINEL